MRSLFRDVHDHILHLKMQRSTTNLQEIKLILLSKMRLPKKDLENLLKKGEANQLLLRLTSC